MQPRVPSAANQPLRNGTFMKRRPSTEAVRSRCDGEYRKQRGYDPQPHSDLAVGTSAILADELPHSPKPLTGSWSPQEDLMRHGKSRQFPAVVALLTVLAVSPAISVTADELQVAPLTLVTSPTPFTPGCN